MNQQKLEFWAKHRYNVLFEGYHGTGKTSMVKSLFTKMYGQLGVDWLYYSASTMDPWVDFVGVPREVKDENNQSYLGLIQPKALAQGSVKAIFIDEFNRCSSPKTSNAVMELLQFKSINGKRFPNLDLIWAAINPDEDDTYDVQRLDPAQKDRFHVHVKIPYDVNPEYFFEKYGRPGESACSWWRGLDEDNRKIISPRRLDTAVQMFMDGGDISDVLPVEEGINTQPLIVQLQDGSYNAMLLNYMATNNKDAAREMFVNENFFYGVESEIFNYAKHGIDYVKFCLPLLPNEKLVQVISNTANMRAREWLTENEPYSKYAHIFDPVLEVNQTSEERQKSGMATSFISKLKSWKRQSGGDDFLTDKEYINMVSESSMNIEFFKSADERQRMLDRLTRIIDINNSLDKVGYIKILGPLLQIMDYGELIEEVKVQLSILDNIFKTKFDVNMGDIMTKDLPGLRRLLNQSIFDNLKNKLIDEGVVKHVALRAA